MNGIRVPKQSGFTIVELLIVIVVIAILAAITLVTYNGIQVRARDTRRSTDIAAILQALDTYNILNSGYPRATSTDGDGFWEYSNETPGTFMEYLSATFPGSTPVDPVNDMTHRYQYYVYSPGDLASYGCPTNKGSMYVFYASGFEKTANAPKSDANLVCSSRTWSGSASNYFKYKFENG